MRAPEGRPYADPYAAGVCLGLVLLSAFLVAGRGLGASGAFATSAAGVAAAIAPHHAAANPYFARYVEAPGGPWLDWLLFEIGGVFIGGFLSARLAGRARFEIERGESSSNGSRILIAFSGGAVMATGAVLARGCTSGQALTGGALLSVGSWTFMLAAFAAAYAVSPMVRRGWR
jgi:hypothetical protein